MSEPIVAERAVSFESASELREAHTSLLEQLDRELARDSSIEGERAAFGRLEAQIRLFLQQGAATGVYLEEVKERTACAVLLEYWVSSLSQAGIQVAGRLARFDGQQLPDLKDKASPYVGLDAFRTGAFFFGREADTEALLAQVRSQPLVVVLGPSGSGKSSLVMGGVLPALGEKETGPPLIVPAFAPGTAVLTHLAEAVLDARGGAASAAADVAGDVERLRADPGYLSAMFSNPETTPVVITIDQFEEVYTLSAIADRDALVSNLARLIESGRGHRVILTMREEFRSRMVELAPLVPYLGKAWYTMRPMGYDELRAAVEKPAALVNLQFQAGIVDDLVKKVLGQPAALPLLQFTLHALWDARDRNRITWEVYRGVGDPLTALKESADKFYDGLAIQTQNEVQRILLELVRVDDLLEAYRQPVLKSSLLRAGKANSEEVLDLLAQSDYLRIKSGAGDATVEVKHESLIRNWPRYVGWIDQKRIERRQRIAVTEAANRWAKSGKPKEGLLTGWQLEEAQRHLDLSPLERDFVDASKDQVDRGREEKAADAVRQRYRARIRKLVAVFVVLTVLGAVYFGWRARQLDLQRVQLERIRDGLQLKAAQLQRDAEELKKDRDIFQEEYKRSRTKTAPLLLGSQSPVPSDRPMRVFLHISSENDRPKAEEVRTQLRAASIRVPEGIEKVLAVSQSDVRYFRPTDRPGAEKVLERLKSLGVDAQPNPIKGFEDKVPVNQYEVWFAPGALDKVQILKR